MPAVGRKRAVDDCKHRHAIAQQRDRDGAAALAGDEVEGAVLRIHQPHVFGGGIAQRGAALFSRKSARHQRGELRPQAILDLEVDGRAAAAAARTVGTIELRAQVLALGLHGCHDFIEGRRQSKTLPRSALTLERRRLPSRRRCLEPKVGRVGRRFFGTYAAASTRACKRSSASARFISRLRCCCALITITPVRVMRWSPRRSRRSFTSGGRHEAPLSKRRWAAFGTLFTFCPPAPWARVAVSSISESGMSMRGICKPHYGHKKRAACAALLSCRVQRLLAVRVAAGGRRRTRGAAGALVLAAAGDRAARARALVLLALVHRAGLLAVLVLGSGLRGALRPGRRRRARSGRRAAARGARRLAGLVAALVVA